MDANDHTDSPIQDSNVLENGVKSPGKTNFITIPGSGNASSVTTPASSVGASTINSISSQPSVPVLQSLQTGFNTASTSSASPVDTDTPIGSAYQKPPNYIGKLGVCAMEHKARSKPCRAILNNLQQHGEFDLVFFNDKVILDEPIERWPHCDFLISFFSTGFPLQKVIEYTKLRQPFLVNDLELQKVLWDRRLVLRLLDAANVPTPERLVVSRDGGPKVDTVVKRKLLKHGVHLKNEEVEKTIRMIDYDTIQLSDGATLTKPFVEKPVDGEDHNVYVYYPLASGGGGRRLFRKVGNKSSEFDPNLVEPRTTGSYIYEKFMDTDNFEDVKAYTVGPNFCHAETRKSPVVDGIVRRNTYGKELRFVTKLSPEECRMARNVCIAFEQTICGFDLLRVGKKSYVIDVNGFSFVKDNNLYYEKCAQILKSILQNASKQRQKGTAPAPAPELATQEQEQWKLKAQISVIRHADRTPKQKFKFTFKSQLFRDLLQGHRVEVIIREKEHLRSVLAVTNEAIASSAEDMAKLQQLRHALSIKLDLPGTKVQIKPRFKNKDADAPLEKVQVILKWGGEATHSSRFQSEDLGEQTRKDILLLNPDALKDVQLFTSSERRVVATAQMFAHTLLKGAAFNLTVAEPLLDDSNAAKSLMDDVKKRLKLMLRKGLSPPPQFAWPEKIPQPFQVLSRVVDLMQYHRRIMNWHFENANVDTFQERWCCQEDPSLFRERWEKLYTEFESVDKVDPSKISELYDTIKFDALHNRAFLERVFELPEDFEMLSSDPEMPDVIPHEEYSGKFKFAKAPMTLFDRPEYARLRELYLLAKILFDYVCPQEYGITNDQKLDIGLLTSMPLVQRITQDMLYNRDSAHGRSTFYFTKESHMYTLLGILFGSNLAVKLKRNQLPELDYLAQVIFEVYECQEGDERKHQVRITISPGCNSLSPLDVQLDSKHCISCVTRRSLTHYMDLDSMCYHLQSQFGRVSMPNNGGLPVKITLDG
ncbi:inositol polyphosphate kinase [Starmerella bacillaris]|uniref:Inositol hexakisphosphate and diphosphoinositol-pentakisphosphate kinase n=1 Tax=Starmerella bacillaris TaxID=1247836 RepID=A0AAV5RG19_STABA|nr:inositol polyphosphate kinase [Starmerella bacillaris]